MQGLRLLPWLPAVPRQAPHAGDDPCDVSVDRNGRPSTADRQGHDSRPVGAQPTHLGTRSDAHASVGQPTQALRPQSEWRNRGKKVGRIGDKHSVGSGIRRREPLPDRRHVLGSRFLKEDFGHCQSISRSRSTPWEASPMIDRPALDTGGYVRRVRADRMDVSQGGTGLWDKFVPA